MIYSTTINLIMPSPEQLKEWLFFLGFAPDKVAPLIVGGIILFIAVKKIIDPIKDRVFGLEQCMIEIQSVMKTKYKSMDLRYAVAAYGKTKSPVVLKEEFRPFIIDVGLDKEIQAKETELLDWLKAQNLKTGIDAQDKILNLITSGQIEKYLDLTKYKQNLYLKGKTSDDEWGVLWIYLSEILIPKLTFDIKK